MNRMETLPESWDTARDSAFFALTSRLFDAAFVAGASVLLGSYDDELVETVPVAAVVTRAPRSRQCTSSWV